MPSKVEEKIARERSRLIGVASQRLVGRYCDALDVGLLVRNEGRYWTFSYRRSIVEYFASSGYVFFINEHRRGLTVPTPFGVRRVLRILRNHWNLDCSIPLPRLVKPKNLKKRIAKFSAVLRKEEAKKERARLARQMVMQLAAREAEARKQQEQQRLAARREEARAIAARRAQERQRRIDQERARWDAYNAYRQRQPNPPEELDATSKSKSKHKRYDPFLVNTSHASWHGRIALESQNCCSVFYRSTGGGRLIRRKGTPYS